MISLSKKQELIPLIGNWFDNKPNHTMIAMEGGKSWYQIRTLLRSWSHLSLNVWSCSFSLCSWSCFLLLYFVCFCVYQIFFVVVCLLFLMKYGRELATVGSPHSFNCIDTSAGILNLFVTHPISFTLPHFYGSILRHGHWPHVKMSLLKHSFFSRKSWGTYWRFLEKNYLVIVAVWYYQFY